CPFLLRAFFAKDEFHRKDATLRELFYLVKNAREQVQHRDARLNFRIVYLDQIRDRYATRDLGSVHGLRRGPDDQRTLAQMNFLPGEYLDICLSFGPPLTTPSVASAGRAGFAGGR
ncbi:Sin3 associated polypeptide p18-domain-containing protein, partial [Thamnocephalis sphaerospora]